MCFYIHSDHKKVKIAEKNIECFKVIKKNDISYWKGFQYNLSKTTLYSQSRFGWEDREKGWTGKWFGVGEKVIERGFHSFSTRDKAKRNNGFDTKIVRFVIPKGTKYYHNPDREEYVSLAIKYIKLRKTKKK